MEAVPAAPLPARDSACVPLLPENASAWSWSAPAPTGRTQGGVNPTDPPTAVAVAAAVAVVVFPVAAVAVAAAVAVVVFPVAAAAVATAFCPFIRFVRTWLKTRKKTMYERYMTTMKAAPAKSQAPVPGVEHGIATHTGAAISALTRAIACSADTNRWPSGCKISHGRMNAQLDEKKKPPF